MEFSREVHHPALDINHLKNFLTIDKTHQDPGFTESIHTFVSDGSNGMIKALQQ